MRASASFRIPVAADANGRLVPPDDAPKRGRYTCPACASAVDLHAGEKKRRHFHHRASGCSAETVTHLAAKQLIVQAVEAWRAGTGAAPVFPRRCAEPGCETTTRQAMPAKVRRAVTELRLRTGHVVDVALLGPADLTIAVVEVLVSHEVDEEKAFEIGIPWVEVSGAEACASGGLVLTPLRDRFVAWLCDAHGHRRGAARREAREDRATKAVLLRALPYAMGDFPGFAIAEDPATCVKGHAMLVFTWKGEEPPWPRPPHVVAWEKGEDLIYDAVAGRGRRVMGFRRAWVSVCARCGGRVAGDQRR